MANSKKKQKFTLKSCAPRPATFNLVHPAHGELDATITMVGPRSPEFMEAGEYASKMFDEKKLAELTTKEMMEYTAAVYAPLIHKWDEAFFGVPCTRDNITKVLLNPENQWVLQEIKRVFEDSKVFFLS
jgi:hypothetical protein